MVNSLMRLGIWSAEDALRFGRNENSFDAWSLLLQASRPRKEVGRLVASEALEYILNTPNESTPYVQQALTQIAKLLANSEAAHDPDLLKRAARKYPENLMIWLAAGRFSANPELVQAARLVHDNAQHPLALRLAAALVFGKEDPEVQQRIVDETLAFARRFGSDDWLTYGTPPDPVSSQRVKAFSEQRPIFAVFAELPASALRKHLDVFIAYQHGFVGDVLFGVFAKAAPEAMVKRLEEYGMVLSDIHGPLVLAGELHPELRQRIENLITPSEYSQLRAKALDASKLTGFTESPLDALTFASQVTLWD